MKDFRLVLYTVILAITLPTELTSLLGFGTSPFCQLYFLQQQELFSMTAMIVTNIYNLHIVIHPELSSNINGWGLRRISSFHVPLISMRWTSPAIHKHCSTLGHSITHDKVEVILAEDIILKRKIKEVKARTIKKKKLWCSSLVMWPP